MSTSPDAKAIPERGREHQGSSDEVLLEKMGYKQELSRSLGFFSSFGIQFSSIAIASAKLSASSTTPGIAGTTSRGCNVTKRSC